MEKQIIDMVVTEQSLEGQRVIAYPYLSLQFDVELPIIKKGKRVVRCCATCDLIKKRTNRADSVPDTVEVALDPSSILPSMISEEEAIEQAEKATLNWVLRRYRVIVAPNIILRKSQVVYHPFLIAEKNGEMILLNVVARSTEQWKVDEFDNIETECNEIDIQEESN